MNLPLIIIGAVVAGFGILAKSPEKKTDTTSEKTLTSGEKSAKNKTGSKKRAKSETGSNETSSENSNSSTGGDNHASDLGKTETEKSLDDVNE